MSLPTNADMHEAIRRIAMTADGRLLYRYLQIELMSSPSDPSSGALHCHEGRRTFARELKSLMDSELAKLGQTVDRRAEHDPDAPAVTEPGKPVSLTRPGSVRRVADYSDTA